MNLELSPNLDLFYEMSKYLAADNDDCHNYVHQKVIEYLKKSVSILITVFYVIDYQDLIAKNWNE